MPDNSRKRIAVIGANGMLGSAMTRVLGENHEVFALVRSADELTRWGIDALRLGVKPENVLTGFDACNPDTVMPLLEQARPNEVINAAGIISQQPESRDDVLMIEINSVWPHALLHACKDVGARMIHMSTDCVFSGKKGMYTEEDIPDASDLYGRSKLLGEISNSKSALTVRTSIVGWQFGPQVSLAGWFAEHHTEELKGFSAAIFSGLTTRALAETVRDIIIPQSDLHGLFHVSVAPIDKYSLLSRLADKMGWSVNLIPDASYETDKSLDSSLFQMTAGWVPPTWDKMLEDMAKDYDAYYG